MKNIVIKLNDNKPTSTHCPFCGRSKIIWHKSRHYNAMKKYGRDISKCVKCEEHYYLIEDKPILRLVQKYENYTND